MHSQQNESPPDPGVLAGPAHWEAYHTDAHRIRIGLPSRLPVSTANCLDLLAQEGLKGKEVLEIGYAPGKVLAWCAARGAQTTGIDYTAHGTAAAESLFRALGLPGRHVTADIFSDHGLAGRFDLVYSIGVIEHFEDPRRIITRHLECCRPGGIALILLPNYGGVYGRMQHFFDPANLAIHNTGIMAPGGVDGCIPALASEHRFFRAGRPHLELVSLDRRIGRIGRLIRLAANVGGWILPSRCGPLSPLWVLRLRRAAA